MIWKMVESEFNCPRRCTEKTQNLSENFNILRNFDNLNRDWPRKKGLQIFPNCATCEM